MCVDSITPLHSVCGHIAGLADALFGADNTNVACLYDAFHYSIDPLHAAIDALSAGVDQVSDLCLVVLSWRCRWWIDIT